MTKAERIVSTALVEALTRTVWVDNHGNTTNGDNPTNAVILNATPAQNGRLVTVRVEPFTDEPPVEIQVTLSPPYEIRAEVDPVRNIPADDEPEPAA